MSEYEKNADKALQDEEVDNSYEEVEEVEETEEVEYEEVEEVEEEQISTFVEQNEGVSTTIQPAQEDNAATGTSEAAHESLEGSTAATQHSDSRQEKESDIASPSAHAAEKSDHHVPVLGGTGGEMDLKAIEAQATKVAKDVQNAALEMSNKLSAGFKSALGSLGTDSSNLTKITGGLASWWGSLDPAPQPKRNEMQERVQASSKATTEIQDLFGLTAEENLVETFKCKLIQTYACSHNSFTPAIQMAFQGTLYITDAHTCFSVEERNRKVPFKISHADIKKATRQRPLRKGDLSDILRLDMLAGEQQFLAFKDFDSGSALDSALALVEHLMEGA
ncbi:hypothetical protein CEUSTIGMA_g598.t1 [Chlamydomonas eustigma]|uniref:GRAM domain-containing protein n=1 Tax=Chlamydomonas eustigma TaxID=1157962 RepID=A0A250WQM0_9CHLO|nr:hypothetical protein CEUSTIGMA_g598.t1 [Chlamydomonas eustigma]|eukprot:GAX73145.1 hypothetical protein CEUSTIGMA_g598.t1 [Chlamydomonas eustigma]